MYGSGGQGYNQQGYNSYNTGSQQPGNTGKLSSTIEFCIWMYKAYKNF